MNKVGWNIMDAHLYDLIKIKEKQLEKAFARHNMSITFVKNQEELFHELKPYFQSGKSVAVGGSMTLEQMDVLSLIRKSDVQFIDRYEKGLTLEQREQRFREAFFADLFITSTNALTMDGCLYNVDGTGNRVAAMIYGPRQVIVIAGINKICVDEQAAIDHIRHWSAPANALRLNKQTPCTKTGHCMDCVGSDCICCSFVKLGYQRIKDRIHIIIVEDELGY